MGRNPDGTYEAGHDADPQRVLASMDAGVPYTTGELAGLVDAPRRTVYNYLSELAGDGRVRYKKPNGRLTIWWKNER